MLTKIDFDSFRSTRRWESFLSLSYNGSRWRTSSVYLAVGIPTLAVLIGFLTNVVQLNIMNTHIGNMETRLDARVNNLGVKVNARFNSLDVKLDTLTWKVIDLDNRVTRIEAKLGLS